MTKSGFNVSLKGADDIFSTEESRQEQRREQIQQIPLAELHPFTNHPFKVLDDESMQRTVESVEQYGVLSPLIARPRPEGGYEIISGHRRQHAAQLAGLDTLPVIVRQMDDNAAVLLMVDSNLQRENILPSERAFAYKMKLETLKKQGARSDLTSRQIVGKLETADLVGKGSGESGRQVQRFIRLTNLIPELLDMVDEKKIAFNPAVELSYLDEAQQRDFLEAMLKEGFYHRPLTVIRPIDIENFLKGMRRNGRSDSYISKARGMLYQIFQKAEANDLVRRNPVRLAEKMRASGTAKRKEAFTTAEVAHLMKVLPDDRMGLSIRLLLGTGMRMQELLALEPQFIEEDGSVIHIRQAVKVVKGTVSIGSPKSKDSIRDIPVPLNVRPCAIKLRDTTDQFIWESPKTGLPCNPTHFRDVFRKSLEEAGDVRLLTPHSCRHTYVSQMQALGVDIQTIQSIVGHADTEMTEHYLHVQESIRQSAIQLFSEAFSA